VRQQWHDDVNDLSIKRPQFDEEQAHGLHQQVRERDYSPPRREKILEFQQHQDFPICPTPEDPDSCNVYRDLQFPEHIYENITHYHEQKSH